MGLFDEDVKDDVVEQGAVEKEVTEKVSKTPKVASETEKVVDGVIEKIVTEFTNNVVGTEQEKFVESRVLDIEVLNTLGYGDTEGLIQTEPGKSVKDPVTGKTKKEGRVVEPSSKIVGYLVKNNGTEPIAYVQDSYSLNGEGAIEKQESVAQEIPAGGTANLTSYAFVTMLIRPEFSSKTSDGKIVYRKNKIAEVDNGTATIEDVIATSYFKYHDAKKSVNDDSVKLQIGEKVGEKANKNGKMVSIFKVAPEYVDAFGFLNIEKAPKVAGERTTKEGKAAGKNMTSAALSNYIASMLGKQAQ